MIRRTLYPSRFQPTLPSSQQEEQVTESRWHQPWSDPSVKSKIGLLASNQQYLAYVRFAAIEVNSEDKWHTSWSLPLPAKRLNLMGGPVFPIDFSVTPVSTSTLFAEHMNSAIYRRVEMVGY